MRYLFKVLVNRVRFKVSVSDFVFRKFTIVFSDLREETSSELYMVLYVAAYVRGFYVLRVLVKLKDGTGVEASFIF